MANFSNLSGTTVSTFKIGKGGITLHQGASPPGTATNGDFWFDTSGQLHARIAGSWELIKFDNISITGNTITSTDTNGDIILAPDGTGNVVLGNFEFDADQSFGAPQDNYVLTYNNSTGLISLEDPAVSISLSGDVSGTGTSNITTTIGNNVVTNAKLSDMAGHTVKVRVGSGSGDPSDLTLADNTLLGRLTGNVTDLTGTEITTILDTFTSGLKGLVPASGGGTTGFLRADGTFAVPPGTGLTEIVQDTTPQLGGNLDAQNNDITGVDAFEAASALFGDNPQNLRAFNVRGTGLDGRLSLQGGSGDNPGLEMTTDGNTSRVLLRLQEIGTDGTSLQFFTEVDGGSIGKHLELGDDGALYYFPGGSSTTAATDAGIRNNGGTMQFKNSAGSWTNIGSGGGGGTVTSVGSGNGMDFTAITASGDVTLGTPSSITSASTNNVSATSHTHELADEAVTLAKLQHVSTDSFLGRDTAGTGDVEVLDAAAAKGILNITSADISDVDSSSSDRDRANHTGTQTMSTISDAGDLATLNTVGTTEIDNEAVTFAKMQPIAQNQILGRTTFTTGPIEQLSASDVRSIINVEDGATADQTAGEIEAIVSHDNLLDFVADEHIDWTTFQSGTVVEANNLPIADGTSPGAVSGPGFGTTKYLSADSSGVISWDTTATLESDLNHDNLTGFVANEHIDWTLTTASLSTSGSVSAGNIQINGSANTISSTNANGDINITPNGTGDVVLGTSSSSSTLEAPAGADAFIIAGQATAGNDGFDLYLRGGSGAGGTGIDGNILIDVGHLGIGTTSPSSKLDIEINASSDTDILRLANIGSAGLRVEFYDAAGTNNGQWRLQAFTGNSDLFEIAKQGTGEIELSLDAGGNMQWRGERVPVCFGSLSSAPSAQGIGDTYYNSTSGNFFIWNGTTWQQIT